MLFRLYGIGTGTFAPPEAGLLSQSLGYCAAAGTGIR